MPEPPDLLAKTREFARRLDADQYEAIRSLLTPDCVYETGHEILKGPDAIIASYREHGERARKLVDRIDYTSDVVEAGSRHVIVVFTDSLTHKGAPHVYRLNQHLHFSKDGLIERIVHEDMPGERERLTEFMNRIGIRRTSE